MKRVDLNAYVPVMDIGVLTAGDKIVFLDGESESYPPVPRVEEGFFHSADLAQGLAEVMVPSRGHTALIEIADIRGVLRKGAPWSPPPITPDLFKTKPAAKAPAQVPLQRVQEVLQHEYNRSLKVHIDAGEHGRWRSEELHRCVCDTIALLMDEMRRLA